MSTLPNKVSVVENLIAAAPDQGFRNRAKLEYRGVKYWTDSLLNWDGANILDFGCGDAIAAASVALRHPGATVTGVDIVPLDEERLRKTFKDQIGADVPENFRFLQIASGAMPDIEGFDLIYSWSVFEHIREAWIEPIYADLKKRLARKGVLFIQVDPLYFSPRGSHLYSVLSEPWHHLLWSIDELHKAVLTDQPNKTRRRLWQQFIELNRLTGEQILTYGKSAGLSLNRQQFFVTEQKPDERLLKIYKEDVLTKFCFQVLFS